MSSSAPSLQLTYDLKTYIELTAYEDLLEIQIDLNRSTEPDVSKLYSKQLEKVRDLLWKNKVYKDSHPMASREIIELSENWATLKERKDSLKKYGITYQDLNDFLKLEEKAKALAEKSAREESFDEEIQIEKIRLNIVLALGGLKEKKDQAIQFLLQTASANLIAGMQIELCTDPLALFIALRLYFIESSLEDPKQFVELDDSMTVCFEKNHAAFFKIPHENKEKLEALPAASPNRWVVAKK